MTSFFLSTVPAAEALEHIRRTGEERDQEVGCTELSATTVSIQLCEVRKMKILGYKPPLLSRFVETAEEAELSALLFLKRDSVKLRENSSQTQTFYSQVNSIKTFFFDKPNITNLVLERFTLSFHHYSLNQN